LLAKLEANAILLDKLSEARGRAARERRRLLGLANELDLSDAEIGKAMGMRPSTANLYRRGALV
jgi:hypothetical protein